MTKVPQIGTDWKPAFYNIKTVGQVFSTLKDKDDLKKVSNVVYKIPCSCGRVYIGQTSQYLGSRMYQHLYSCKNAEKIKDKTALNLHHIETGHRFDFDSVKILDRERIRYKRNVSEMVHISVNNTLNFRTDTENLSNIYSNLLCKFKLYSDQRKNLTGAVS